MAWYAHAEEQIVAECENPFCLSGVCGSQTAEEAVRRWNRRVMMCELKACPFCGGQAELTKFDNGECDMYTVQCKNPECQAETTASNKAEDVISIWNRRNNEKGEVD